MRIRKSKLGRIENFAAGLTIESGKHYSQSVEDSFHVSMAALELDDDYKSKSRPPIRVMVQHDKKDFLLCSLLYGTLIQQQLDLDFTEGEQVTFFLEGSGVVHLTGSLVQEKPFEVGDEPILGSPPESDEDGMEVSEDESDGKDEEDEEEVPSLQQLAQGDDVESDEEDEEDWIPEQEETSCARVSDSDSFDGRKDLTEQSNGQSMDTLQTWSMAEALNQPSSSSVQKNKSHTCKDGKPKKAKQKVQKKTLEEWLQSFPWSQFDKDSDKVFCGICRKFPKIADKKKTKFVEGCIPFKRETLVVHDKSRCHTLCLKQLQAKKETPVVFGWCSPTDEESDVKQSNLTSTPAVERTEMVTTVDSLDEGTACVK
ncbi:46 kDa FK506-binding nuclear protein [Holothuria leucospilota]|uniref:46 kDa FK506-binding nuclear protein n=1 Tax=Holothuria leucospilota TaxID=206669 RepID=A0A9Q1C6Y6_HOLLE|nr:46 kDa FK506-binding nuclear protein [Holothuria leucospilota]